MVADDSLRSLRATSLESSPPTGGVDGSGESAALFSELYEELKRLAVARMAAERTGHTLQATALVHEAFVRLNGGPDRSPRWENRRHFFAAASEAMRRILVDHARRRARKKRGDGIEDLPFDEAGAPLLASHPDDKVLAVHEALDVLAAEDPLKAEIVRLRFFVGLDHAEIAALLALGERTVRRHWAVAKVRLFEEIHRATA